MDILRRTTPKGFKVYDKAAGKARGVVSHGLLGKGGNVLCSEYFVQMDRDASCMWSTKDAPSLTEVVLQGKLRKVILTELEQLQLKPLFVETAKWFDEWRDVHAAIEDDPRPRFLPWMQTQVDMAAQEGTDVDIFGHQILGILRGPAVQAIQASRMWAYGLHICTVDCDQKFVTQDCVLKLDYWVNCVAHPNDPDPVVAQLPYVGKVVRILKVTFRAADYVLVKMDWFKTMWNADQTDMLRDSSGMYIVDPRNSIRSDRSEDEPFMLMSPKVEQVFLCEIPN